MCSGERRIESTLNYINDSTKTHCKNYNCPEKKSKKPKKFNLKIFQKFPLKQKEKKRILYGAF